MAWGDGAGGGCCGWLAGCGSLPACAATISARRSAGRASRNAWSTAPSLGDPMSMSSARGTAGSSAAAATAAGPTSAISWSASPSSYDIKPTRLHAWIGFAPVYIDELHKAVVEPTA